MAERAGPPPGPPSPTELLVEVHAARRMVRIGLAVLIGSVVISLASAVMTTVVLADAYDGPSLVAPGTKAVHLESGAKAIYEASTRSASFGIVPSDVVVTGPKGALAVGPIDHHQTVIGETDYDIRAQFVVEEAGDYTITITADDPAEVLVADRTSDVSNRLVLWSILMLGSLVAFAGSLIAIIVGLTRRSRATRALGPEHRQPPGAPRY